MQGPGACWKAFRASRPIEAAWCVSTILCLSTHIVEMFLLVRGRLVREIILWHDVECLDPATRNQAVPFVCEGMMDG